MLYYIILHYITLHYFNYMGGAGGGHRREQNLRGEDRVHLRARGLIKMYTK